MNKYAKKKGLPFDKNGELASNGNKINSLTSENKLDLNISDDIFKRTSKVKKITVYVNK